MISPEVLADIATGRIELTQSMLLSLTPKEALRLQRMQHNNDRKFHEPQGGPQTKIVESVLIRPQRSA